MTRALALTAAVSSLLTLTAVHLAGGPGVTRAPRFENGRVRVVEVTYPAGVPREPYVRPTDQVIVFLDDCQYQRRDPQTGETRTVSRKAGEAIWHDKGEHAPELTNRGARPYRTLMVELK